MAVVSGTVQTVNTIQADAVDGLQEALVLFTVSGTYAQANNGQLLGVDALIKASRRNGRTVTLVGAMVGQSASKASNPAAFMGLKTVAVSTSDVTFEITDGDYTTEFADATAVPTQSRPFGIRVAFVEAILP